MSDIAYARSADGTHVAYRVFEQTAKGSPGVGLDVVMTSGGLIPMELFEGDPGLLRLLDGLRSLGRVVVFDRRGLGLSDPIADWSRPILDQWADDLAAVVEASGVSEPAIFAWDGYGIATRFAASHPDRLRMLVLHHPVMMADDEWDEKVAERRSLLRKNVDGDADDFLMQIAPSRAADVSFRDWYARAGRVGASPATAAKIWESVFMSRPADQLLERVRAPTLVLLRRGNAYAPANAVRLASAHISNSALVELDGADHFPFLGDVDEILAEVAEFVVGERRLPPPERIVAALLFTDIVASTERAAVLGGNHWKSLLDRHDDIVRAAVGGCGGDVVKTTGDGVLAILRSAGAAIRSAEKIRDALSADGLEVRIGIHVGDVDWRGDDISGVGVHIAARAMSTAESGQIVVTAPVVTAVVGEDVRFDSLGSHVLRGVPGTWELLQVRGRNDVPQVRK